jgi:hypothetical protein
LKFSALSKLWPTIASLLILGVILPAIEAFSQAAPPIAIALQSLIFTSLAALLFAMWSRAKWARTLAKKLVSDGGGSTVWLVRAKELESHRISVFVLRVGEAGLEFFGRSTSLHIKKTDLREVELIVNGFTAPDSVVFDTALYGKIALTPLQIDGVIAGDAAEAALLSKQLSRGGSVIS